MTDPQSRLVPGALVAAHQLQTNVTSETVTDQDGRFRFPYLKVVPYEITVHLDGFKDATLRLTLTVGSAFDLPVSLLLGGVDTTVTVTGDRDRPRSSAQPDRRHCLGDRGSDTADERPELSRSCAAGAWRLAD